MHDDPLDFAMEVFENSYLKSFNDNNFIRNKIKRLVEWTDQEVRSMSNKRYEQTHKGTFTPAALANSSCVLSRHHSQSNSEELML